MRRPLKCSLVVLLSACALLGCGTAPAPQKSAAPPPSAAAAAVKPGGQDAAFFARIVNKELGDASGKVELRENGILIHPGDTTPTSVTFSLGGELKELRLKLFIAPLGPQGSPVPEAGNVNVALFADGRPVFNGYLDRNTNISKSFDVSGVKQLLVRVDNANGKSWFDWFFISVQSSTRA